MKVKGPTERDMIERLLEVSSIDHEDARRRKLLNALLLSSLALTAIALSIRTPPNIPALLGLCVVAFISWFSAHSLRRAMVELRAANRTLRQRGEMLQESERKFRMLYEDAPLGYQSLDENGYILEVNKAWCELMGYDREEVIGRWFGDFQSPRSRESFPERFAHFKATGEIHGVQVELIRKDGSLITAAFEGTISHDEQGRQRTHCMMQDITERWRLEEALRKSEERFRLLAENAQDLIYLYRLQPERGFEYVSSAATAITGYTPEEHYADPDLGLKIVHPDDLPLLQKYFQGKGTFGEPITFRWIRKDGSEICAEQRNVPIYDETGNLVAIEGIACDVTDRKKAEEALRESEALFRQVWQSSVDGMRLIDGEGTVVQVNDAYCRIVGKSREELEGQPFPIVYAAQDQEPVLSVYRQRYAAGTLVARFEGQHTMWDGRKLWLETTNSYLQREGQPPLVLSIYRDETKRRETEEAVLQERDKAQQYLDVAAMMLLVLDAEAKVTLINKKGCEILGCQEKEILGKNWIENFLPERIRDEVKTVLAKALAGEIEEVEYHENPVLTASGEERLIAWHNAMLTDEAGHIIGTLSSGEDITERRQAEEELRKRTAQLEALRQIGLQLAAELDLETLLHSIVARAMELLGATSGGMYLYRPERDVLEWAVSIGPHLAPIGTILQRGEGLSGKVWETDQPLIVDDYKNWEGRAAALHGYPITAVVGVPIRCGDEFLGVLDILADAPRTFSPDDAELLSLFASHAAIAIRNARLYEALQRELAERKRAEEALQVEKAYLEQLFEGAPEAIVLISDGDRIRRINSEFTRMFGYTSEEAVGRSIDELVAPGDLYEEAVVLTKQVTSGESVAVETVRQRKDGTRFDVSVLGTKPFPVAEGQVANYAIYRDISERKRVERAWRESEERYRDLYDSVPVGLYRSTPEGRNLAANAAAIKMLGYPDLATLQAAYLPDIYVDPADRQRWMAMMEKMGFVQGFEVQWRRRDGSVIWGRETARAVRDEDGHLLYYEGSVEDITERKRVEEALQRESIYLQQLFESSPEAIALVGSDSRIRNVNEAFTTLFGYAPGEAIGHTLDELIVPPEFYKEAVSLTERVLRRETVTLESVRQRKDGTLVAVSIVDVPFEIAKGEIARYAIYHDISERKRAEEMLTRERNLLRTLIDNLPDFIYAKDTEGRFTLANVAVAHLMGVGTPYGLLGKTDFDFYPEELARRYYADEQEIIRSGRSLVNREEPGQDAAGRQRWISTTKVPLRNGLGNIIGLVGIGRDITEQRQLQAQFLQAQKMEAVGRLAGGVAHDFNNWLTAIQGYAGLAMEQVERDAPLHRDLEQISNAAMRAAGIVRQLLLFSRRQPMAFVSFHLNETVEGLLKMLGRLIGEDIAIVTDLQPDLWEVRGDQTNIEQVIVNLAVNARDAMPEGGRLTIRTESVILDEAYCATIPEARPGRYVRLSVEDTGIGMSEEIMSHLFEPFFTTKEVGKGTGLGLATVYGIVKEHEGWINVYSEVGKGSIFRVYLPAFLGERRFRDREPVLLEGLRGHGERILLVEDESAVREAARRTLAAYGYIVFTAPGVEAARTLFASEEGQFDLLISDVVMPDGSGFHLAEELVEEKPALRVLLSSGYSDERAQWSSIQQRGFGFLQKPYTVIDLLRATQGALAAER